MGEPQCSKCKGEHRTSRCVYHCQRCNLLHENCECIEYFLKEREGEIANYPGGVSLHYEQRIIGGFPEWRVVLQVEQITKVNHVRDATHALLARRDGLVKWQGLSTSERSKFFDALDRLHKRKTRETSFPKLAEKLNRRISDGIIDGIEYVEKRNKELKIKFSLSPYSFRSYKELLWLGF